MEKETVKKYFEDNAMSWILDGYKDDGYNYPVAYHRLRIIREVLSNSNLSDRAVDLGCGGGDVSLMLADLGFNVTGVDQSKNMIEIGNERLSKASADIQKKLKFVNRPLDENGLETGSHDVCLAMGVIGYLPNDEILFDVAHQLLKPGGLFLVSCRNRLFNMQSISFRTIDEINNGEAIKLIEEMDELYERIPLEAADKMVSDFKRIANELPQNTSYANEEMASPSEKHNPEKPQESNLHPRQHTPKRLKATANKCGFEYVDYYGVHPHLIDPRLNTLMPPQLFNTISDSLEAFERLPIALTYNSVFIGVFQKS